MVNESDRLGSRQQGPDARKDQKRLLRRRLELLRRQNARPLALEGRRLLRQQLPLRGGEHLRKQTGNFRRVGPELVELGKSEGDGFVKLGLSFFVPKLCEIFVGLGNQIRGAVVRPGGEKTRGGAATWSRGGKVNVTETIFFLSSAVRSSIQVWLMLRGGHSNQDSFYT